MLQSCMKILVDMIWLIVNLKSCIIVLGMKDLTLYLVFSLCIGMTKNKNYGEYRTIKESKNTYIECIRETERF